MPPTRFKWKISYKDNAIKLKIKLEYNKLRILSELRVNRVLIRNAQFSLKIKKMGFYSYLIKKS